MNYFEIEDGKPTVGWGQENKYNNGNLINKWTNRETNLKFCEIIIIIPKLVYGSRTYDKRRKIDGKIQAQEIQFQGVYL